MKILLIVIIVCLVLFLSSLKYHKISGFYMHKYAFQKLLGYHDFYDRLAWLFLKLPHKSIEFQYNNAHWRIELWKGKYILYLGCEIGIYKCARFCKKLFFGVSADEMLTMSLQLKVHNIQIAERFPTKTWWLTSFRFNLTPSLTPDDLTQIVSITFPNAAMYTAFCNAFHALHDTEIKIINSNNTDYRLWLQW